MKTHPISDSLSYDRTTGIFYRKLKNGETRKTGTLRKDGYLQCTINKKCYLLHRLAWLFETGRFPENQIDHINRNKKDNRISNLRDVTNSENHFNMPNTKGYYYFKRTKKWVAQIKVNGNCKGLGYFNTEEEARDAYIEAKKNTHKIRGMYV